MFRSALICLCAAALWGAAPLPQKYKRWLDEEVPYLIANYERKAFLELKDDPSRDRFIEEFWEARNPARGSGRNPYREEIERRLVYVNANFGRESGTPGWRTDMGRTWIMFGKPDSRVPLKGFSQLYPLELWMYSNNTGSHVLPGFFYVLFFMPNDIGEYRYYKPFTDGPMSLVRGSQFQTNQDVYRFLQSIRGDVAHAAFSLIPSEPLDTETFRPSMTGDALVARLQDWADTPDMVARVRQGHALVAHVESAISLASDQPLSADILPLAGFDGTWWLDYAVLVNNPEYGRRDGEHLLVNAGFRLLTPKGDLIIEDSEQRGYTAFGADGAFVPFVLANRIPIVPGEYRLEISLKNPASSRIYKIERPVSVSRSQDMALSTPILACVAERAGADGGDAPFRFGGVQFNPLVDGWASRVTPLRTLVEVRPGRGPARDVAVEYVIANITDRDQRITMNDRISAMEFRNGILLKARTIAIDKLASGNYRVIVTARDPDSGVTLASTSAALRIQETAPQRPFYLLANLRGAASNGLAAYIRGLASIAVQDRAAAALYLRDAIRMNPANTSARAALASLK
jgi:GWxTD domain-containing protein